jgi:hypothetical protein
VTAGFPGSSAGIADPAVKVTNGALIWNGSAGVNAKIAAANIQTDTITATEIAAGAVGTSELASSAVTDAKVSTGLGLSKLAQGGGTTGQVLTWNGSSWAPATPAGGTPSAHAATHLPAGTDAIDFSGKIIIRGLESARPAASSANLGSIYFASDTLTVWRSDGSAWTLLSWNPEGLLNGGAVVECYSRRLATADAACLTSGVMTLVALPLYKGFVVNRLSVEVGTTAAGSPTHSWAALYDLGLSLLSQSVDGTTAAFAINSSKTFTLAAAQTIAATGIYYAAVMVAAGTVPTLRASSGFANTDFVNGIASGQAMLIATNGSGLTGTAPAGPITLTAKTPGFYVVAS